MAASKNPLAEKFKVSDEVLPPKDPKAAAIASLDAKCRRIVNLANDVREAHSAMREAESAIRGAKNAPAEEFEAALVKASSAAVSFGGLRSELYKLKAEIEADIEEYNIRRGYGIFVAHTAAGLPIRVNTQCRKELWD